MATGGTNCEVSSGEGRQGLRPWIIARVNSGSIEGLRWCDQEKTMFEIPWTHKGTQKWNEETGRIFVEYEKHTGRYQEGSVTPFNYSGSKQRLRSALGKSNDFRHIKDVDRPDVRIYRVVQRTPPRQLIHEQPACPFSRGHGGNFLQVLDALIPVSVDQYSVVSGSEAHLPSDLEIIHTSDMLAAAPASDPMIVSIDTDIDMLSKSMGSMEISGCGPGQNGSSNRKILIENGNCSAVMCHNVPSCGVADGSYDVSAMCQAAPVYHGANTISQPVVSDQNVPFGDGSFASTVDQHLDPSLFELDYQQNNFTIPSSTGDAGGTLSTFEDQLPSDRFPQDDAWFRDLLDHSNTDDVSPGTNYESPSSAATNRESPSATSDQWDDEVANYTNSMTNEWTTSECERIFTELLDTELFTV